MIKMQLFDKQDENGVTQGVGEAITFDAVQSFLNANLKNEVQFDIATLGGDLNTGLRIHDLIKSHPKKTVANIVGLTASAGTVIADACDEINISENALFLVHNGWKQVEGNVYDMQKAVTDLAKTDAIMIKIYRDRTGMDEIKIKEIMKASDWMSPVEALDYGFVDNIIPAGTKIAASVIMSQAINAKINSQLLIKLQEKMKIPWKSGQAQADPTIDPTISAMTELQDGEYKLEDGRTIIVTGGMVTLKETEQVAPEATASSDAVIASVAAMLVNSEAKISALIEAKLKPLETLASTHKPVKGAGPINVGQASVNNDLQTKIEAKQEEIRLAYEAKRKGV